MRLQRRKELYREVLDNPRGRELLIDLMKKFHVLRPVTVSGDQYTSAFNDGARSVVLSIMTIINKDHGHLLDELERAISKEEIES